MFQASHDPGRRVAKERNFLPVIERPGLIANVDFSRTEAHSNQFADKLMIEIEPIAFQANVMEAVAAEHLVHRERIAQSLAEYRIEKPRKKEMTQIHHIGDAALLAKMADLPAIISGPVPRPENEARLETSNRIE